MEKTLLNKLEEKANMCRKERSMVLAEAEKKETLLQRKYCNHRFVKYASDTVIRLDNINGDYHNGGEKYPSMFKYMGSLGEKIERRDVVKEEFILELKSERKRHGHNKKEINSYIREIKETPYGKSETEKQHSHQYGCTDFIPIVGRALNEKRNKANIYENPRAYWALNKNRISKLKSKAFNMYHSGIDFALTIGAASYGLYLLGMLDK